jgi:hypothetical protein
MEGHVPIGRGNTSVGTLAARVLDPLPSRLECVAHVRRLNSGASPMGAPSCTLFNWFTSPAQCSARQHSAMARKFKSSWNRSLRHGNRYWYPPGATRRRARGLRSSQAGISRAYLRSSNARDCDDRQLCWNHSDFFQCEYLAPANNASASNGTSSGQYRAGLGWRAPVSERGRQASTAMLQRTGMAARP